MISHGRTRYFSLALLIGLLVTPSVVGGQQFPSSDLLVPYFETDLSGFKLTTLIEVTNSGEVQVPVKLAVFTNWGIPVLEIQQSLDPRETKAYNLRDWLMLGLLPDGGSLTPEELLDLQAKLSGQASPVDQLYYSTEVAPQLAVGYVTLRTQGIPRRDALWGSVFTVDPEGDSGQGETLIDIDPSARCRDICERHNLFWIEGGDFDGGTEVIVWTGRRGVPSVDPLPDPEMARATIEPYDLEGNAMSGHVARLMAVESLKVADLGLTQGAGWIDLTTRPSVGSGFQASYVALRHTAENRFSMALRAWCREIETPGDETPRIRIEKLTNGEDADTPTGPILRPGDPVAWEYVVTNVGPVPLSDVVVTDDQGVSVSCPSTDLGVGAAMTCTASGTAVLGQYRNVGTATGRGPDGTTTLDDDPSHYKGEETGISSIDLEKATNGFDADTPPGVLLDPGAPITWTYVVTNTGDLALASIVVTDDQGVAVSCPLATLGSGQSMTCTGSGVAQADTQYTNVGTVTGIDPEGNTRSDSDPSNYTSAGDPDLPQIALEKATNGHDADVPTGPVLTVGDPVIWTYVVTNTGNVSLTGVGVTDDQGVAVSCPLSTLAAGQSMTCTGTGTAQLGQYANIGTASGNGAGQTVFDSDPSHYFGEAPPIVAIGIEKATNGHDADVPTGPVLTVGDPVTWTYVVINAGNVSLSAVAVTDDRGVAVSCPLSTLAPGQSMTCTGHGTAEAGQYSNIGTATGIGAGQNVSDSDPSHYFGQHTMCPPNLFFESDSNGQALTAGQIIDDEFAAEGIHVTTSSPGGHPAMIFDSSSPTGNDFDLGSPNESCAGGGPGEGSGGAPGGPGANCQARGNILIVSEDGDSSDPDDAGGGGTLIFTFDHPTRVDSVQIMDIDNSGEVGTIRAFDGAGALIASGSMLALGNNSFQEVAVGAVGARRLEVRFPKSGALPGITFCAP